MRTATATVLASLLAAACGSPSPPPPSPPASPPPAVAESAPETPAPETPAADDDAPDVEYDYGKFVRRELITPVPDQAAAFYGALFGWRFEAGVVYQGDHEIGRVRQHDPSSGVPIGWLSWISVEDVDDMLRDVAANGGRQVIAPARAGGEYRAIVAGPTGGVFGILHADAGDDTESRPGVGDWYWSQLWSNDFEVALGFYQVVGGYTSVEYTYGKLRYMVLKTDGVARGVIVRAPAGQNSRWLPVVLVDNVDAVIKKARGLKAKVIVEPRNVDGIGRIAALQAPTGGVVGVIVPVQPSDD